MSKVTCINNRFLSDRLTLDKEYDVIAKDRVCGSLCFRVVDDGDYPAFYECYRFKTTIEEENSEG